MIFAREITDGLTSLVKKIDEATVKNSKARMGSFVVMCRNDPDKKLQSALKDLAKANDLKETPLVIDIPPGPPGYGIAKDAEITVLLYRRKEVVKNFAFRKGEFQAKDIDRILAELPSILEPAKKK